ATADCLPLIFYDTYNEVCAIVHAGWRGSVQGIAVKALQRLQNTFNTQRENLRIFLGPCAGMCCYSVGQDLIDEVKKFSFWQNVIEEREEKIFFDLAQFNIQLFKQEGFSP